MQSRSRSSLRRPLIWLGIILLIALVVGGGYWFLNPSGTHPPALATVTRGDLKAMVNANARVRSQRSVKLAFPFSGLVTKVNILEGDTVKAGDVIAEMDNRDAQRRVAQAEANLAARQQDLAEAQQPPSATELEIAQQTLKKAALALAAAQDQFKKDGSEENRVAQEIAQSDYDIARANFDRQTRAPTTFELDTLQRAIDSAQMDLDNARETLAETQLKAPFDGTITEVDADAGALLGGYSPVAVLEDTSKLELLADIDEIDVAEVEEGQNADLHFDAFPGDSATGKVARLFPAASNERGATIYHAIISLDPTDLKLRPGMGATVSIATVEKKNVLRVPSRAVKNAGSQKIVVVLDGSGTRNAVVQVGVSDGSETEIVSGVQEGTVIVLE